jgi:short subunit dehydrogenase-like uncharacterized protein
MPARTLLIYGANGFTGELIAEEAVGRGLRPVLAGRDREAVGALARRFDLEGRVFGLDDQGALSRGLEGVAAVLHCAGPFVHTSEPMVTACLTAGVHYLDITGEITVFEAVQRRGIEAESAGVALIPGVGFDVVPTDCLAARLGAALPDATHLTLAFTSEGGATSRGTMKTMVESLPHAGAVREDGRIVPVPIAMDAREFEFSCGPRWAVTIPWGDVSTAFHTTGIPNIRVYSGMPPGRIRRMRRMRPFLPLAGLTPVKRLAQWWIGRTVTGPDEEVRRSARICLWGEVRNEMGGARRATMETPEGYTLTATASVECALRVLDGEVTPGAWTPARAFGADLVFGLQGVTGGEVLTPGH